jgi:hypothetical protein
MLLNEPKLNDTVTSEHDMSAVSLQTVSIYRRV